MVTDTFVTLKENVKIRATRIIVKEEAANQDKPSNRMLLDKTVLHIKI